MDLKPMWDGHQDAKIVSAQEVIIQPQPWTQEKSILVLPLELMTFLRHMLPTIIEGKLASCCHFAVSVCCGNKNSFAMYLKKSFDVSTVANWRPK